MGPLRTTAPRLLDFDFENRPLSYLGGDFTTPEITVAAWKMLPRGDLFCVWQPEHTVRDMLLAFVNAYDEADIVTGHNIIRHDLRLANAMLLELGLSPLGPKLVSDTYAHLKKRSPGFASQENLAAMLGVRAPKVRMSSHAWRDANRMTPEAVIRATDRAVGDVKQHIQLRARLLELGWLHGPRRWQP